MSFYRETPIKAVRKRHVCEGCSKWIEPGEAALYLACNQDDAFFRGHYHPDCREAEIALNDLKDCRSGDEWTPLFECDQEDAAWLKAEWPVPYLRLCMTREQWAALVAAQTKRIIQIAGGK